MFRVLAAMIFAGVAFAQNVPDAEMARAAAAPFDLARYVESHVGLDWERLWQTLGAKNLAGIAPCTSKCSTEVVSLLKPDQAIVVVEGEPHKFAIYLRYLQDAKSGWSFAGAYGASVVNTDPLHRIAHLGDKAFLQVAIQGPQFGREPNEQEVWFDLTQSGFDPVFSFPTDSDQRVSADNITRHVSGVAHAESSEAIELILSVDFDFFGTQLGSEDYTGRFERRVEEAGYMLRSASIPNQEFLELEDVLVQPSVEKMLVYALPGLKELAKGKGSEAKDELKLLLAKCKDTPERRLLMELMK